MTTEFRQVMFQVRTRLIQLRERLARDSATAQSEPMTIEDAIGLLEQAINLELARTHGVGGKPARRAQEPLGRVAALPPTPRPKHKEASANSPPT